jgi:hypothetical protein
MTMHLRLFTTKILTDGEHPKLSMDKSDYKGFVVECSEEKAQRIFELVEKELSDEH